MKQKKSSEYPIKGISRQMWAVTNYGVIHSIGYSQKQAIQVCEKTCGGKWDELGKYHDVRRVTITEGWKP